MAELITFNFVIAAPAKTSAAEQAAGAAVLRDMKFPLELDTTGDMVFLSDIAAISSDLKSRWLTFKGEWFLDLDMGIDYWGVVFSKRASLSAIEAEYYREAMACPGIIGASIKATQSGRKLTVRSVCETDTGKIFTATLGVVRSE